MASRITKKFQQLAKKGDAANIIYITGGFPSLDETLPLMRELEKSGTDIIEFGIPFSDPVADGPTIQETSQRAIENGMTLAKGLDIVKEFRKGSELPVVIFSYYNPIYKMGVNEFIERAAAAGADGALVVDLSPEESGEFVAAARAKHFDTIMLIAPTSPADRITLADGHSSGFVYAVSLTGVTGARDHLPDDLTGFVARASALVTKPLAVGFGIANAEMAAKVGRIADGAVIGSAVMKILLKGGAGSIKEAGTFVQSISQALQGVKKAL